MIQISPRFVPVLLLWFCSINAMASDSVEQAAGILGRSEPDVVWDTESAKVADVTCDGIADTVMAGYQGRDIVTIGMVPGGDKDRVAVPTVMTFSVGEMAQDSFCGTPVWIETSPIQCRDEEYGDLPGCREVKGCNDFSLADGKCDAFHFYWDSERKGIVWWRR